MRLILICCTITLLCNTILSQSPAGKPAAISGLKNYQLVIDAGINFNEKTDYEKGLKANLNLGEFGRVNVELFSTEILSENYILNSKKRHGAHAEFITLYGTSSDGGNVRLTLAEKFVYGYVEYQDETYWLEPLSYLSEEKSGEDGVVVYRTTDVDTMSGISCGVTEAMEKGHDLEERVRGHGMRSSTCYAVELAIASDFSMYEKYNSNITDVELHNVAVINNVNGDYSGSFNDNIQFVIVEQFVSDCSNCDPWTASTDAQDLLLDFTGWGQNGGFNTTFDLGELWTNRNFDGATVGLAWVNQVCAGYKYHVLQDFTSLATFLRVLVSHEIGHNFNALHDPSGSPHIMAPAVQSTNTWSATSINVISDKIDDLSGGNCLSACGSPPVAGFSASEQSLCPGDQVHFIDESTNSPTSWHWTFSGGDPQTSTAQNPVVTYSNPGSYPVSLVTVNIHGSDTLVLTGYITVTPLPESFFTFEVSNQLHVEFSNNSSNAQDYTWTFGDGTNSSLKNPVKNYSGQGEYTVQLTGINMCGTDTYSTILSVGPCINDLLITGNIQSGAYVAGNTIIIQGNISSTEEVYFHAPNGIDVLEGFNLSQGGVMELSASGCTQ